MTEPLRVAYTLEQCWHDVPGGTAVATLEVLRRLRDRDDVAVVGVAGRHRTAPADPFRPGVPVAFLRVARPWLYETWNRWEWPRVESATGPVDVCHSTLAIPAATRAPHVVTVHDVAFVHAPERFTAHGVRVMRAGLERCRRADLLLCPSRSTADRLGELGFDERAVRVVPWGVEPVDVDAAALAGVRRRYGLPSEFALFVGTLEPRKNLVRIAAALRAVPELPLVVAGPDGWGDEGRPDGVDRAVGFLPERDLRAVMQAATVLVYASLEEGFGLPILEAMAQGTPVVTSRGSSTEEVAGGSAVLVDPHDPAAIADGVRTVLADRSGWVDRARRRAAACSWTATAEATVAAYREAAR